MPHGFQMTAPCFREWKSLSRHNWWPYQHLCLVWRVWRWDFHLKCTIQRILLQFQLWTLILLRLKPQTLHQPFNHAPLRPSASKAIWLDFILAKDQQWRKIKTSTSQEPLLGETPMLSKSTKEEESRKYGIHFRSLLEKFQCKQRKKNLASFLWELIGLLCVFQICIWFYGFYHPRHKRVEKLSCFPSHSSLVLASGQIDCTQTKWFTHREEKKHF